MVAVPIYTSEVSQPQVRKTTGSFTLMCYSTGFAFCLIFGALFPWRWAVGVVMIVPACCFFILMFCPETPSWYLSKGREEDAKAALIKLRGEDNMDIVEAEFNRIVLNMKIQEKENELNQDQTPSKLAILTDMTFWKPFSFLMVVFCLAFEWTGLPAIAFYMVPLLKASQVPIDPFWCGAMLASYRALMSIVGKYLLLVIWHSSGL